MFWGDVINAFGSQEQRPQANGQACSHRASLQLSKLPVPSAAPAHPRAKGVWRPRRHRELVWHRAARVARAQRSVWLGAGSRHARAVQEA